MFRSCVPTPLPILSDQRYCFFCDQRCNVVSRQVLSQKADIKEARAHPRARTPTRARTHARVHPRTRHAQVNAVLARTAKLSDLEAREQAGSQMCAQPRRAAALPEYPAVTSNPSVPGSTR